VHVDGAVPIEPFKEALQDLRNVYFFDNRVDVPWGSWKMIEVQLLGVESALRDERSGFCMLVSGQDYPIKHPDMLRATLEANHEKLFINSVPMEELWDDYYRRVNHYNYGYREPYRFFYTSLLFFGAISIGCAPWSTLESCCCLSANYVYWDRSLFLVDSRVIQSLWR